MENNELFSYGVSDISYEEMCSTDGGFWRWALTLCLGGIEDFGAGYRAAQ